jgi:seryl-tRNA synthetase
MLDIKFIRENPEKVKQGLKNKGANVDLNEVLMLDTRKRDLIKKIDDYRAFKNQFSKKIINAPPEEKQKMIAEMKEFDRDNDKLDDKLKEVDKKLQTLLRLIPNLPKDDVTIGKDGDDNQVRYKIGKPPKFAFKPLDYMEIGERLDIIDTARAAKVSGSRFGYLKRELAQLEFAIVQYAIDVLTKNNFCPIIPPVLISKKAMAAMGYMDRGADEIYKTQDDLYLVGTSEQSMGPMHMDEIIDENQLPLRYVAFSACFRREAGSYGKDTRGILRVHQFDKLEMFSFTRPEESDKEHAFLLKMEEKLMKGLKLPYQVINICSGDLGDPAARKWDIETWLPSENKYRETHSTSTCTDYQARRLNIRLRRKDGKVEFLHTLNGTAFAIGRILIMILENFQQKDGSIKIPAVLHKYCGFKKISFSKQKSTKKPSKFL